MKAEDETTHLLQITTEVLKNRLGIELLTNTTITLSALNKLYALWDLMLLTDKETKNPNYARAERNRAVAIIFSIGILHELYGALQKLCSSVNQGGASQKKIIDLLSIYDSNRQMRDLMGRYRNNLSFHLHDGLISTLDEDHVRLTEGVDIFLKFEKPISRDTYFFASDEALQRAFFRKECRIATDDSQFWKTFAKIYNRKIGALFDYVSKVHKFIMENGDILISTILEEYNLQADDFRLEDG